MFELMHTLYSIYHWISNIEFQTWQCSIWVVCASIGSNSFALAIYTWTLTRYVTTYFYCLEVICIDCKPSFLFWNSKFWLLSQSIAFEICLFYVMQSCKLIMNANMVYIGVWSFLNGLYEGGRGPYVMIGTTLMCNDRDNVGNERLYMPNNRWFGLFEGCLKRALQLLIEKVQSHFISYQIHEDGNLTVFFFRTFFMWD